jgi:hypothetical protein
VRVSSFTGSSDWSTWRWWFCFVNEVSKSAVRSHAEAPVLNHIRLWTVVLLCSVARAAD